MRRHVYLNILTAILIYYLCPVNTSQANFIQSSEGKGIRRQDFDLTQLHKKNSLLARKAKSVQTLCNKVSEAFNAQMRIGRDFVDDIMNDPCMQAANSFMVWLFHGIIPHGDRRKSLAKADDANWKNVIATFENMLGYPIKIDNILRNIHYRRERLEEVKFDICDKISRIFEDKFEIESVEFSSENALIDPCNRALGVVRKLSPDDFKNNRIEHAQSTEKTLEDAKEKTMEDLTKLFKNIYGYSIDNLMDNNTMTNLGKTMRSANLCSDLSDILEDELTDERSNITEILDDPCMKAMEAFKNLMFETLLSDKKPSQQRNPLKRFSKQRSLTQSITDAWSKFIGVFENMLGQPADESVKNISERSQTAGDFDFCDRVTTVFEQNLPKRRISMEEILLHPCVNAANQFALWVIHQLLPTKGSTSRNNVSKKTPYRIVGGYEVQIADFPFIVAYGSGCGGTILNKYWILTAAHCGSQDTKINAGSTKHFKGETHYIEKHIIHEGWDPNNIDNDFQLLKLKTPLEFNSFIQPIEIGSQQDIKPGEEVTVIGWGKTQEIGNHMADGLRAVDIPILAQERCSDKLSVTKNMFCAGLSSGEKDACQGDSGGPAIINNQLIGVVSFGVGCGRPGYPGVYARVPIATDWIRSTINRFSSQSVKNRIGGGYETQINDHPYIVDYNDGCGGSIIGRKWILTAAHCGVGLRVKVGSSIKGGGKLHTVKRNLIHPKFGKSGAINEFDYDFQLLELETPLIYSDTVQPIEMEFSPSVIKDGALATVTGWGPASEGEASSKVLRSVEVPIIAGEKSISLPRGNNFRITNRMLFAGLPTGRKDSCQGDSGGPITLNNKIIGVVSFGIGCARANAPGIHSRVSVVEIWVCDITGIC